jgi:uncharacterized protein YqeY
MSIFDQVSKDLQQAMRDRDKDRTSALRNVRAKFIEAVKLDASITSIGDDQASDILRKLAKERRESIELYKQGHREDLASAEQKELEIIESFLPKLADEATTRGWVQTAIQETGAAGMQDVGKVMAAVMAAHKQDIDGKVANRIAREMLGPRPA